ncbi:MAG: membrane protein insertase YidC [Candidatus Sungbacteria bacterium]|nr:membrane protein insertase YidC [Candidatus Sungbacteria bacterium]
MISSFYHEIFYRPLVNLLVFFYQGIPYHDLGLAIILVTVLIRILLYPLMTKSLKSQKEMADIQPQLRVIQEKYKNNKEEQAKRVMEFYKEKGVNPFSGCLPILIQLPLLFALYQVFAGAANGQLLREIYSFVPRPDALSPIGFGFLDLSHRSIVLAVVAGISQFLQAYLMPKPVKSLGPENAMQNAIQNQTTFVLPIIITIISFNFPAALPLYWIVLNIIGIIQQEVIKRKK